MDAGVAAALLFGLGRAQAATLERHRFPEAVATLERALEGFAAAGEIERVVAVADSIAVWMRKATKGLPASSACCMACVTSMDTTLPGSTPAGIRTPGSLPMEGIA